MIARMMTMRAELWRNSAGKDSYGHKKKDGWNPIQDAIPCYIFVEHTKEIINGQSVAVESIRGYFRSGLDIQRDDRIMQIKDRRDQVLFEGPMEVDMVTDKLLGASALHIVVALRRVRG